MNDKAKGDYVNSAEIDGGHGGEQAVEQGKPLEDAVPERERRSHSEPRQEGVLAPRAPSGLRRERRPVGKRARAWPVCFIYIYDGALNFRNRMKEEMG